MGAFKFRGAYNALSQLDAERARRGVVAFSSGNHAQAVALAGTAARASATTIVMPADAPAREARGDARLRRRGRAVRPRQREDREADRRAQLAAERGLTLIPPFDHPHVIAGQGTAAKELIEEAGPLDVLLVPLRRRRACCRARALAARAPVAGCRVIGVEPEAGDDATRSFRAGSSCTIDDARHHRRRRAHAVARRAHVPAGAGARGRHASP